MPPRQNRPSVPSRQNQPPLQTRSNGHARPANEGVAAKSRGEKYTNSWRIAKNSTIKDPTRIMATVGNATNTFISYNRNFEFFFWGSPKNVARARVDLETNISQDNPTFQRNHEVIGPPRDAEFETMGCFVWPSTEYPPEKELGQHNFERLNPIRQENWCFIEYNVSRSSFMVKGAYHDVEEALLRIKGLLCKSVAQRSPVQRLYLIQNDCQEVSLGHYAHPAMYHIGAAQEPRLENSVKSIGPKLKQEDLVANAKRMKDCVMQTTSKVHWHQGHIDLRVHLGTLVLIQHKPFEKISLPKYKEMVADSYNFSARVTDELGDKSLEDDLLVRFRSATTSLEPCDISIKRLADVEPEYMATIEVDIRDGRGNLQITKEWHRKKGNFYASQPLYRRMVEKPGKGSDRIRFLEVSISDMLTNLTWLLDISAVGVQNPTELPKATQDHGDYYVNINAARALEEKAFCDFESWEGTPRPLAHKRAIEEKIVWKFDMKAPYVGYEVELAKVFIKKYTPCEILGREPVTAFEPRWSVDVKHREWSAQFAENHELGVGKSATWRPDIQSWFPVDSDDRNVKIKGHVELLYVLQRVQDIVLGNSL